MFQIAIAVRDGDLFLIASVVRAVATDVYVNWPRDYVPGWEPHTSQHASGEYHQKSFGQTFDVRQEQKPDANFKGTKKVVSFGAANSEHVALNIRCDSRDFDAVFEIPIALVRPEKYSTWVQVDLVEPDVEPTLTPGELLKQHTYTDAAPWIVISFLDTGFRQQGARPATDAGHAKPVAI